MSRESEDHFCVFLHDRLVGWLHRRGDVTRFVFDEGYWDDPGRPVLGLRFEDNRQERYRSHMRLPPWFSNLLPEGRLRQWIAEARRISVQREMELLAQVGHDLPGAVRVIAADSSIPVDTSGDSEADVPSSTFADSLWRFSLAGVGLKFSMLAHGERLTIPAVGDHGDWILKPPHPLYPDVPRNEYAMMTLAKRVGIDVPEVRLIHRDQIDALPDQTWAARESWAYAVKRFDRGLQRERIHIEDMAQVRGFYPDDKYLGSFETIGALIYRNRDVRGLQEFARRMAFNIIIGNGDAHLKNWSLIYHDGRIPGISPAYDLVSTFFYRPKEEGVEDMGLRFGGAKHFADIRLSAFSRLDSKLGAKADLADVAKTVVDQIVIEWPEIAELLKENSEISQEIGNFIGDRVAQLSRR